MVHSISKEEVGPRGRRQRLKEDPQGGQRLLDARHWSRIGVLRASRASQNKKLAGGRRGERGREFCCAKFFSFFFPSGLGRTIHMCIFVQIRAVTWACVVHQPSSQFLITFRRLHKWLLGRLKMLDLDFSVFDGVP